MLTQAGSQREPEKLWEAQLPPRENAKRGGQGRVSFLQTPLQLRDPRDLQRALVISHPSGKIDYNWGSKTGGFWHCPPPPGDGT